MEVKIGEVTHYFNNISVAVLDLMDELKLGDEIHIRGHTTDFSQAVDSMQEDREDVESATPGMDIAIRVKKRVREGDEVFKVTEEE